MTCLSQPPHYKLVESSQNFEKKLTFLQYVLRMLLKIKLSIIYSPLATFSLAYHFSL